MRKLHMCLYILLERTVFQLSCFPPVRYHLWWICTPNKNKALKTNNFCFSAIFWNLLWRKFWNHFQAEIIPRGPMFLDFLTVFYMIWKNQESCESWLVGFWVSRHSKMQKNSVSNIFGIFEPPLWPYEFLLFLIL